MKYIILTAALFTFCACSSSGNKSGGVSFGFSAPAVTDQEFENGVPAPDDELGRDLPYETQLRMDGGAYVRPAKKKAAPAK